MTMDTDVERDANVQGTLNTDQLSNVKSAEDGVSVIESFVKAQRVVMFGKQTCPFCIEAHATLESQGVHVQYVKLDNLANASAVHGALKKHTNQKTVPYVFINGELLGGCDDVKAAQRSGKLDAALAQALEEGGKPEQTKDHLQATGVDVGRPPVVSTLFNFPSTLDNRVIRMNGLQAFALAVLGAVFKTSKTMHWVVLFLFVDFTLRFLGGGGMSPIALNGSLVTAVMERFGSKPVFSPGPPKQFASLCGMMFSGLGALFLLMDHSSSGSSWQNWVGAAWLIGLAGAAGLEGFLNFCLGCVFFGIGIKLGIFPHQVYTVHLNTKAETENTWEEMNSRLNQGPPQEHRRQQRDYPKETTVDRRYKEKTDEMSREDFGLVKHAKVMYWICPLVLLALALLWKEVKDRNAFLSSDCLRTTADVLAIIAVVVFISFLALWCLRVALYPRKSLKEWQCPVALQLHCAPCIGLVIIAALVESDSERLARVVFWIGAVGNLAISVLMLTRWAFAARDFEHITPTLLIPAIGNFFSAAVLPLVSTAQDKDLDTAWIWFGFGLFNFLGLLPVILYKVFLSANADPVMRPLLFILVATPAAASIALSNIQGPLWLDQSLFFFSLMMLAVMVLGFWPARFFGAGKFHMSYWGYGFGVVALAVACSQYQAQNDCQNSRRLLVVALITASWASLVLVQHSVSALIRRQIFTPESKWGPMSFMRLTHEAFRDIIPRILLALDQVQDGSSPGPLIALWEKFCMLHDVHSWHEDTIIFPTAARYFPGVQDAYHEEHASGHVTIPRITALVAQLNCVKPNIAIVPELSSQLKSFFQSMESHLKSEETHIQPIIRKYLPLAMHKEVIKRVFKETEISLLFKYIPAVLNHLPHITQRERFVRTFLWAMPESAQHLGLMISIGVSPVMWYQLTQAIPDIVPRGNPGWMRFH